MTDTVILVNERDEEIGSSEKMEAHEMGLLHRAFSLIVFNADGEMLIHQRSEKKYHGKGLWSNACCSHPGPGESIGTAIERRAMEELGIHCKGKFLFKLKYDFEMEGGLREHEMDHVFIGNCNESPNPDLEEIQDWKYIKISELIGWVEESPKLFTPWFKLILSKMDLEKMAN